MALFKIYSMEETVDENGKVSKVDRGRHLGDVYAKGTEDGNYLKQAGKAMMRFVEVHRPEMNMTQAGMDATLVELYHHKKDDSSVSEVAQYPDEYGTPVLAYYRHIRQSRRFRDINEISALYMVYEQRPEE